MEGKEFKNKDWPREKLSPALTFYGTSFTGNLRNVEFFLIIVIYLSRLAHRTILNVKN